MTAHYCPRCRHCRGPEATPAARVVSGRAPAEDAPRLSAAWAATLLRLDDTWQARKDIACDVAEDTDCARHTIENLIRAAVVEGVLEGDYFRSDLDGRVRAHVRIPTEQRATTP